MTGHVALASSGRPPFRAAPPGRLKTAHREQRTPQKQRHQQEHSSLSFSALGSTNLAAFSTPFTPFAPCLPRLFRKPSNSGVELPKSVVGEYIRRRIYTPEKGPSARNGSAAVVSACTHEEKNICIAPPVNAQAPPESALPWASTAGRRQQSRNQPNDFDNKSFPARIRTPRPAVNSGRRTSTKTLAAAPANPSKVDTADIITLRSCILHNQRKLTELATELKRVATPYALNQQLVQRGEVDRCHARRCEDQSAPPDQKSRFPSAPAGSRRYIDAGGRKINTFYDKTSEVPVSRDVTGRRSQPASDFPQQEDTALKGEKLEQTVGSRSASTPASFSRLDGAFKSRSLKPATATPGATPQNAANTTVTRNIHPNRGAKDLSKTLVRKEPLSAKQVRKLVFAWKSADQQLKEKMNFWVRDLPAEVRDRVRAASGIEKKFLALRDCVSFLWKASEERALAVLEMHQTMAYSKECYQSQQGQVESALVGVQGGLLAASTKIKQIDRLIRLQTGFGSDEVRSSAGFYPFTPHISVYTPSARNLEAVNFDTDKVSTDTSGSEPAAGAGTVEGRGNRKSSCFSVEANEAHIGPTPAAEQTPLCRTKGTNTSAAQPVGCTAAPAGAYKFTAPVGLAPEDFLNRAATPTTPGASHTTDYERVKTTLFDQCRLYSTRITSSAVGMPEYTTQNCGAAKTTKAAGAAEMTLERERDRCPPASFCAASMRRSTPYSAYGGVLTQKVVESPNACDEIEVNRETKISNDCTVPGTSNQVVSPVWNRMEKKSPYLPSCAGREQKTDGGTPVGALGFPPSEGVGLETSLRSFENRSFTDRQEFRSDGISRTSPFSSSGASLSPCPCFAAVDDKSKKILKFDFQGKTADLLAQLPTPSGPYQLTKQAEHTFACASETNDRTNDLHVEALRDAQQNLSGLHSNQRSCLAKGSFQRIRTSGAVSECANPYALPSRDECDSATMTKAPRKLHNEDVSWAADLVARWRAQRG